MSESKRYAMSWGKDDNDYIFVHPVEQNDGNWVQWAEMVRALSENTSLKGDVDRLRSRYAEAMDEMRHLKAEVERLRKAGDELLREWSSGDETDARNFKKGLVLWNEAKEGKQS